MKPLSLLLMIFVFANSFNFLFAQTNAHTIKGIITGNQKKIEAATIYVLRSKDSTILKTGISDKEGAFVIEDVAEGSYLLSVEAIGYRKFYSDVFSLNSSNPTYNVNTITLAAAD